MKRTIIALAALVTFSFATINSNAHSLIQDTDSTLIQDQRTEIKYEESPKAVRTTFEESQFGQWEVTEVYEVITTQAKLYELTITNGTQSGTLTFDEEGNIVQ